MFDQQFRSNQAESHRQKNPRGGHTVGDGAHEQFRCCPFSLSDQLDESTGHAEQKHSGNERHHRSESQSTVFSVVWPYWNRSLAPAARRSRSPAELTTILVITGDVGLYHLGRIDDTIELRFRDEAEFERGRLQREVAVHRMMRDL
jgi:hypothetical protein